MRYCAIEYSLSAGCVTAWGRSGGVFVILEPTLCGLCPASARDDRVWQSCETAVALQLRACCWGLCVSAGWRLQRRHS
jgi:hypothetical protein